MQCLFFIIEKARQMKSRKATRRGKENASYVKCKLRSRWKGVSSWIAFMKTEGAIEPIVNDPHQCGIFKLSYTDSRLLHCVHTFCKGCVLHLSYNHRDVTCPVCLFVSKMRTKAPYMRSGKVSRVRATKTSTRRDGNASRGRRGSGVKGRLRLKPVRKATIIVSKNTQEADQDLNDHECGICKKPYTDPRLLHCMHTFCKECVLQQLVNGDKQDIACPVCGFLTKVDASEPMQLCRNHVIQQKVKWDQVSVMRDQGEVYCSDCEAELAIKFCTDCGLKLCDLCTAHHKRLTRFKGHSIQNIEAVSNEDLFEKEPILCPKHHLEMRYFCDNCEAMICGECGQCKPHQGHVFQPLNEVMDSRLASLQESLDKSEKVCKDYEDYLRDMEIFYAKSVEECDASKRRIEDAFAELIGILLEEKQKMFDWLDEECASSERALKSAKERLGHVKSMSQYLKDVSLYPKEEMFDVVHEGVVRWEDAVGQMKAVVDMKPPIPNFDALNFSTFRSDSSTASRNNSKDSEDKFAIEIHARQIKVDDSFADIKSYLQRLDFSQPDTHRPDSNGGFTFHEAVFPGPAGEISLELNHVTNMTETAHSQPVKIGDLFWSFCFEPKTDDNEDNVEIYAGPEFVLDGVSKNANTHVHVAITLKNHTNADLTRTFTHKYEGDYRHWGFKSFLSWDDLLDPTQGWIKNESVTIRVRIQILPVK